VDAEPEPDPETGPGLEVGLLTPPPNPVHPKLTRLGLIPLPTTPLESTLTLLSAFVVGDEAGPSWIERLLPSSPSPNDVPLPLHPKTPPPPIPSAPPDPAPVLADPTLFVLPKKLPPTRPKARS
jgi:hypothetical protein